MTQHRRYASPAAFRRALTDRLNAAAKSGSWTPQQLQRQVAYDRLLERLYLLDDRWIVKGATALLARNLGVRGTLDIDLYGRPLETPPKPTYGELRVPTSATGSPSRSAPAHPSATTRRAYLSTPSSARPRGSASHLDLVGTAVQMTGRPENVPPLARGLIPDVTQRGYRAYPLVDHIADKIAATYDRYGSSRMPSTRYRDLVDLVAIITGASVDATAQRAALESEFARRGHALPDHFDIPDRALWIPGYAAEARRSLLNTAESLDGALALVRPFIEPLLGRAGHGTWHPGRGNWT